MTRRGFTILEVTLAAAMGAIILLAGAMLFLVMDRSDRSAKNRFETTAEMQRTRLVMQRVFSQLLVTDEAKPPKPRADEAESGGKPVATPSGAAAAASRRNQRDPNAPPPPPRIILGMPENVAPSSGGPGGYNAAVFQRLEAVVFDSPIPAERVVGIDAWTRGGRSSLGVRGRGTSKDGASSAPEEKSIKGVEPSPREDIEAAEEEAEQPVRAFRGSFEFLPQPLREGEIPDMTQQPRYQLWWVPMPPRRPVDDVIDPLRDASIRANLARPYLLCSDVVAAGWRLFDDRERKTAAMVTYEDELPAYIEFQIQTSTGIRAEWMFEVGWAKGPEVRKPRNKPTGGKEGESADDAAKAGKGAGDNGAGIPAPGGGGKESK